MTAMAKIGVIRENIVKMDVDAIVNAANTSLLGGGGVDGAIHNAAGPDLLEACRKLGGCETGQAKATAGFRLPAKWVIHTVGPVWVGGQNDEPKLLASCYRQSLSMAVELQARTVAFPAISTGIFNYPVEEAAAIAVKATMDFLGQNPPVDKVWFVCFSEQDEKVFQTALGAAKK